MATQYTSLLGLALPVTGELSGTWGDTVNTAITSLLDSAVAGTTTLSADTDVTLTTTTGVANQARQAIILWTANGSVTRNVTAPAQSKIYTVINASAGTQSIVIRGAGPTTGVTIIKGESAQVAWNGSDFVKISSSAGDVTVRNLTVTGNLSVEGNSTLGNASGDAVTINGNANFTNVNPTLTAGTANGVAYLNGSKVLTTGSALTFDGTNFGVGVATGTAPIDVASNSGAVGVILRGRSADNIGTLEFKSNDGATVRAQLQSRGDELRFLSAGNVPITSYVNGSEQMRLTSTGLGLANGKFIAFSNAPSASSFALYGDTNTTVLNGPSGGVVQFNIANAEQMRLTSTGLGIGTSSPGVKLDVVGNIRATRTTQDTQIIAANTGGVMLIAKDSSTGSSFGSAYSSNIYSDGAYPMLFWTNGTERMRLDSVGNLGLGVTPSAWNSDYKSVSVSNFAEFYGRVATPAVGVAYNAFRNSGGSWIYKTTNAAARYEQDSGFHIWSTAPSGTAGNAISFTQAMTLDASGRLLVGVTSGSYALDVGDVSGGNMFRFTRSGVELSGFISGGVPFFGSTTNNALVLMTNATERARIDSSGRFMVGSTFAFSNAISAVGTNTVLDSYGQLSAITTDSQGVNVGGQVSLGGKYRNIGGASDYCSFGGIAGRKENSTDGNFAGYLQFLVSNHPSGQIERARITSVGNLLVGATSGAARLVVREVANLSEADPHFEITNDDYSGFHWLDGTAYYIGQNSGIRSLRIYSSAETAGVNLAAGGTSWGTFSDERLKYDIEPITNGLVKLANVRCVSYRLKDVDAADSQKKLGVIAQDLVGVVDEVLDITKRSGDDTEYMSVRYTELIPVLVKAIQEQQAIINQLKARLDAANL